MSKSRRLGILIASTLLALLVLAPSDSRDTHAGTAEPPPNDDFANATEISELPFETTVDLEFATIEKDERSPSCVFPLPNLFSTVWFRYTAVDDTVLVLSATPGGFSSGVAIWTDSEFGLDNIHCDSGFTSITAFTPEPGRTYYFQLQDGLEMDFSLIAVERPANDDFENATLVTTLPFVDQLHTGAATHPAGEPNACFAMFGRPPAYNVWYAYAPANDTTVVLNTGGSDIRPQINVMTGSPGDFELVDCLNIIVSRDPPRMKVELQGGQLYYFHVGGGIGKLSLNISEGVPASNDHFTGAIDVAALPFDHQVDSIAAGLEPGEPLPTCMTDSDDGSSVWYRIAPREQGSLLVVEAQRTDIYPKLAVYRGSSLGSIEQIVCYGEVAPPILLGVEAFPGEAYYLQVATLGDGGLVDLSISEREIPDCPSPDVLVVDTTDDIHFFSDAPLDDFPYHDIVSTGLTVTEDYVCVLSAFLGETEPPAQGSFRGIEARLSFDTDPDVGQRGGRFYCDPRDTDFVFSFFGSYGQLARIGPREARDFAVITFAEQTMTIAVPREFIGNGPFRYALEAVTPLGVFKASDCAPNAGMIQMPPPPAGDANCNDAVDAVDASVILQLSASIIRNIDCHGAADANGDGKVDPIDAALILQLSAGLLEELPGAP